MIDSYLVGVGALADDPVALGWLRIGTRLGLRPTGRSRIEVCAPDGRSLGWLPSADAWAVLDLMQAGTPATARVRGLVPAFQRPRVQLTIELAAQAA